MTKAFNPKTPLWPTEVQMAVVNAHTEDIAMMRSAQDIPEWNVLRHVIRATMPNRLEYNMLMGYIDNVVFPSMQNLKKR